MDKLFFYVFSCHCGSCVLYLSVTDGVCTGQCFLTEICSDTLLMQKYRDISLKGASNPRLPYVSLTRLENQSQLTYVEPNETRLMAAFSKLSALTPNE